MREHSVGCLCAPASGQNPAGVHHVPTLDYALSFCCCGQRHGPTGMLQLRQELNLSLQSWSCDPSSHPSVMGHQYKMGPVWVSSPSNNKY